MYGYYAALNLLEARPLFSKMKIVELLDPATRGGRASIERHHLFPKAYLKTLGIESAKDTNQIANLAFVEWPDNAEIGARSPADYFPSLWEREKDPKSASFWHALPPGWEEMEYRDFLDARRKLIAKVVRAGYERLVAGEAPEEPQRLEALVAGGENANVELKSAARYNEHTKQRDERVELAIVKSVAGFANGTGGTLVIGVNDDGVPVGLENDLKLVPKADLDRYELWLTGLLDERLGRSALAGVSVTFPELVSTVVCRVDARPSHRPIFVNSSKDGDKNADFYVRMGNSTRKLRTDEVLDYQRTRWP